MERYYRLARADETFHAVERNGELRRAEFSAGGMLGVPSVGDTIAGGLAAVDVLAPVKPSKVVCVGLNYRDHAREVGKALPPEPLLFIKPPSAVLDPGRPILLPPGVGRVDYEGELGVVIGTRAHRIRAQDAWSVVLGLTCVNDVTARDLQNTDTQYTRCKGFDTFAPIGPAVAVGLGAGPRRIETRVNGVRRQSSDTSQLIFSIEQLIEYVTFIMTLEPGDVLATGTPSGIGPLVHGDVVTVSIDGIGELTNPVLEEARASSP